MLLRHNFQYLLARGVPGLVNFASLAIYTRLLTTDQFGRYALVLATVGLVDVMLFQWLRLVLVRFVSGDSGPLLDGIRALFISIALPVSLCVALMTGLAAEPSWRLLIALGGLLLVLQAWFELNLAFASARLLPSAYGRLSATKAIGALVIGTLLAWHQWGAAAPLVGLLGGQILALGAFGLISPIAGWRRPSFSKDLGQQLAYGLPLTLTFALVWIVTTSDRLMIGWLMDEHAVGSYAVGYDLGQNSLGLLLSISNTAAYPLAVRSMEKLGADAARRQLVQNNSLISALAFAGAAGMIILAPLLVDVFVGASFRAGALEVLPIVAVIAAVSGIKSFCFDVVFHLNRSSRVLVATNAIAAIANIGLNLLLIPRLGIAGAAWATLLAFAIAAFASMWMGRQFFPLSHYTSIAGKSIICATACAMGAWLCSPISPGIIGLIGGVLGGMASFTATALIVDVGGVRDELFRRLRTAR